MNIVSMRQKVLKAINKAPQTVRVFREEQVDDGAGGYYSSAPTLVTECNGILNNSSSGGITINVSSGGIVNKSNGITFITVYQDGVEFRKGDYFILNNTKYEITNAINILNLNIYWEIQLEVIVGVNTPEPELPRQDEPDLPEDDTLEEEGDI